MLAGDFLNTFFFTVKIYIIRFFNKYLVHFSYSIECNKIKYIINNNIIYNNKPFIYYDPN